MSQGRVTVMVARGVVHRGMRRSRSVAGRRPPALYGPWRGRKHGRRPACFGDGSVDVVEVANGVYDYWLCPRCPIRNWHWSSDSPLTAQYRLSVRRAAADALRSVAPDRLVLIHPPWVRRRDRSDGRRRTSGARDSTHSAEGDRPPRDPSRVQTAGITDWVSRHLCDGDAALFMAGNSFRARSGRSRENWSNVPVRLVLQANEVLLWSIFAATHTPLTIEGCGKLFRTPPTTSVTMPGAGAPVHLDETLTTSLRI